VLKGSSWNRRSAQQHAGASPFLGHFISGLPFLSGFQAHLFSPVDARHIWVQAQAISRLVSEMEDHTELGDVIFARLRKADARFLGKDYLASAASFGIALSSYHFCVSKSIRFADWLLRILREQLRENEETTSFSQSAQQWIEKLRSAAPAEENIVPK